MKRSEERGGERKRRREKEVITWVCLGHSNDVASSFFPLFASIKDAFLVRKPLPVSVRS